MMLAGVKDRKGACCTRSLGPGQDEREDQYADSNAEHAPARPPVPKAQTCYESQHDILSRSRIWNQLASYKQYTFWPFSLHRSYGHKRHAPRLEPQWHH